MLATLLTSYAKEPWLREVVSGFWECKTALRNNCDSAERLIHCSA